MANVKISGLPAATSVTAGTDVAPLVSGGITTKATPQQIVNAGLLAPGAIGSGTASTGAFTTLSASSTVSGTGFSTYLASPPAIGSTAPSTGKFTTVESTIATGTAPFTVASTTNVANLNASSLGGATFASPGAIGSGTASTGAFTTLSASSTVSGTGFSTYLLSPPAIGTTAPAAGKFTDLTSTGNTTIGDASTDTFTVYPQTISLINSTAITAASTKTITLNGGAGSNGLIVDASNNIGIGAASSGAKVNVTCATNAAGLRITDGTYAGNITPSSLGGIAFVVEGAYAQIFYVNGSERARIDSSGALTVPNIYTNTTASVTYVAVSSTGLLQRGGVSALKYKQDIRDLESIDINKFRAVRYKSKCENDDQTIDYFGFIADEVEEAGIKELITYNDAGEPEGFQYERMTVVLLKAIQELSAELNELKAKVNVNV